jgi:hypothetical protein
MRAAGHILTLALVLLATTTHADEAREAQAREAQARSYFSIGQGHYHLGEYGEAIDAFQAGYRLKALPLFLFNIAQAARKSERYQMALDYYVQYLEREPMRTAPQRTEAESWVVKLRRAQAEGKLRPAHGGRGWKDPFAEDEPSEPRGPRSAPVAAKPAPVAPPPKPTPAPAPALATAEPPSSSPALNLTPSPTVTATATADAPATRKPVWKRGWFWGTLAAVAVAGAAVGVGTWLGLETRSPPSPSLGSVPF